MKILAIILIGISLSMDAFSLSLLYSNKKLLKKDIIKISLSVGIFHFFMPLLGLFFGSIILKFIKINPELITSIILSIIGLEMIINGLKIEEKKNMMILEIFAFSLAVSIDSFSVGIGLSKIVSNILMSPFIFSITSFSFTYLGLIIGKNIKIKLGNYANIIGGIILILLGITYIL